VNGELISSTSLERTRTPADFYRIHDMKEKVKMEDNRHIWEAALKKYFEDFLRKVKMAEVPEVFTLTFLKAEVEEMENHIQGWIDLSKQL
jgi:hypothetical protein